MAIKIGAIEAFNITNFDHIPDDRQTKHETIGGVVVQDFGRVEKGDTLSFEADIKAKDKAVFFGYWYNRTYVTIVDEAGNVYEGCRVRVTRHRYVSRDFAKYEHCVLEIWRI